jgi:hypothetical protein
VALASSLITAVSVSSTQASGASATSCSDADLLDRVGCATGAATRSPRQRLGTLRVRQRTRHRQAARITSTDRLDQPALLGTSMNTAEMAPSSGWFHPGSASAPTSTRSRVRKIGW